MPGVGKWYTASINLVTKVVWWLDSVLVVSAVILFLIRSFSRLNTSDLRAVLVSSMNRDWKSSSVISFE